MLLVEDDASIREVTALGLAAGGFEVVTAVDGPSALARFRADRPDLVVLDLMLPVLDGLTVCRTIRAESSVPVVMLTARTDAIDVVAGLQAGADDYVRKPFELPELLARLQVALRHGAPPTTTGHATAPPAPDGGGAAGTAGPPPQPLLRLGPLEIDEEAHEVRRASQSVSLTSTEFRLLVALARHPGRVLTREVLLDEVWGYDFLGDSRLVDVAIQRLRAKVEDDPDAPRLIQTIRGAGYRAAPPSIRPTSGARGPGVP